MRRPHRRRAGEPRIPTWLLVTGVVLLLGAAGWLFVTGENDSRSDDDPATTTTATTSTEASDQNELQLPDPSDLETGDGSSAAASSANGDSSSATSSPASLAALRGMRIALAGSASAAPSRASDSTVPVGTLRMPCAAEADESRAALEAALLAALTRALEQAGATVVHADDPAACVDVRARRLQGTDIGLVVEAADESGILAYAGRPARGAQPAPQSTVLARELATSIGSDASTPTATRALRTHMERVGAIDLAGGAPLAYLSIPLVTMDRAARDELVAALVTGTARFAVRADSGTT